VPLKGLEAEVEMAWSGLAGLLDGTSTAYAACRRLARAHQRGALALTAPAPVEPFAVACARTRT
jgi:hypothetical protein